MDLDEAKAVLELIATSLDLLAAADDITTEQETEVRKRCWIKKRREDRTDCESIKFLLREYKLSFDGDKFKSHLRMDEECFGRLLSLIERDISKQSTTMRACVPAAERLAVTLRFLAIGETFKELDADTKLSESFLGKAIIDVCESIYKNGRDLFLKFPNTEDAWLQIAKEFEDQWQFPHCLGAIDGKHISFKPRAENAPIYHNKKGFKSIVLLAVADAHAKFTFVDIGCSGRVSFGEVLNRSAFMEILQNGDEYLPPMGRIGNNRITPYVFVGDNAFPLLKHLMTPYPCTTSDPQEVIFNNRLSLARQNIDRAFGILYSRFKILQKQVRLDEIKTTKIAQACCVLHNFMIMNSSWYMENTTTRLEDNIPSELEGSAEVEQQADEISIGRYEDVRSTFKEYFCNEGKI